MEAGKASKSRRLLRKRSSVVPSCIPEGLDPLFNAKKALNNDIKIPNEKLAPIFNRPSKNVKPIAPIFIKPPHNKVLKAAKTQNDIIVINDKKSSTKVKCAARDISYLLKEEIPTEDLGNQNSVKEQNLNPENIGTYPKSQMFELTPFTETCHILQPSEVISAPISSSLNCVNSTNHKVLRPEWSHYSSTLENVSPKEFSLLKQFADSHHTIKDELEILDPPTDSKSAKRKATQVSSKKKIQKTCHTFKNEKSYLYTIKYTPHDSSRGIWEKRKVSEFKNWLEDWCLIKRDEFEEEEEENKVRCLLLEGATGSGKTSLVYALAAELGYKVIEVNASSSRSGLEIRSKLKEVTSSHHMEYNKSNISKDSSCSLKSYPLQTKQLKNCPDAKKTSKNGASQQKNGSSILKFFNTGATQLPKSDKSHKPNVTKKKLAEQQPSQQEAGVSLSSQTLILFEDVDVVFDQDEGFWKAVNEFVHNSKKPVVLTSTTSLPIILSKLKENFKLISLDYPTLNGTLDYINDVISKENIKLDAKIPRLLLESYGGDLRRSLLQLQFWSFGNNLRHLHNLPVGKLDAWTKSIVPKMFNFIPESNVLNNIKCQGQLTSVCIPSVEPLSSKNYADLESNTENDFTFLTEKKEEEVDIKPSVPTATKTLQQIIPILENLSFLSATLSDSDMFSKLSDAIPRESIPEEFMYYNDDESVSPQIPIDLSCTLNFLASKEIQTKFEDACTSHPELQPHLLLPQVQPVLEGQRVFKGQALAQQVRNSGFFRHLSNSAVHLDFTPYVRKIMTIENHKIANRRSKRYLHYLDSINIDSSKFRELL